MTAGTFDDAGEAPAPQTFSYTDKSAWATVHPTQTRVCGPQYFEFLNSEFLILHFGEADPLPAAAGEMRVELTRV